MAIKINNKNIDINNIWVNNRKIGAIISNNRTIMCRHTRQNTQTTPATCEFSGESKTLCACCSEVLSTTTMPALGHDYYLASYQAPTCTEGGQEETRCSRCDYISGSYLPPEGHNRVFDWAPVEPTCTESGWEVYNCDKCYANYEEVEVPALGHHEQYDGYCTNCGELLPDKALYDFILCLDPIPVDRYEYAGRGTRYPGTDVIITISGPFSETITITNQKDPATNKYIDKCTASNFQVHIDEEGLWLVTLPVGNRDTAFNVLDHCYHGELTVEVCYTDMDAQAYNTGREYYAISVSEDSVEYTDDEGGHWISRRVGRISGGWSW